MVSLTNASSDFFVIGLILKPNLHRKNYVSTRLSLASVACSGQLPRHGSFTDPMLQFLTNCSIQSFGSPALAGPFPYTTSRGAHAGHGGVGLWSLKSSRSFVIDRVRTHDRPKSIARSARIDPTPHLEVTSAKNANQRDLRVSADAESAINDLPRAPRPQEIL